MRIATRAELMGMLRKCQVYDWKYGIPRPHKQICGRPLDANALRQESAGTSTKFTLSDFQSLPKDEKALTQLLFPPPRPGYRRSPALVYQLGMLKENRDVDYMVSPGIETNPHNSNAWADYSHATGPSTGTSEEPSCY